MLIALLLTLAPVDANAQKKQKIYEETVIRLNKRNKVATHAKKSRHGNKNGMYRNMVNVSGMPQNMVLVERGHLTMGFEKTDSMWGFNAPYRHISVEDFLMDATEVTNAQYREFVNDIISGIVEERLRMPEYGYDINMVMKSLYIENPYTGERHIDEKQLLYAYQRYDKDGAQRARRYFELGQKDMIISKDTAYIDSTGTVVCERLQRPYQGDEDFLNTYIVSIYPDTLCWSMDFPGADMSLYSQYYFSHPDYDDYPVVGVSWEQANAYCAWRTEKEKELLGEEYGSTQPYRLPTEAEWEYAARTSDNWRYPWETWGDEKGRYYANYMPDEGAYADDGNIITARVATYLPNPYGLYDMAGNVAEWTATTYRTVGVRQMNNINPQYDQLTDDNPSVIRRKTVRGGSWKDSERYLQGAWRTYDMQDAQHSYIGFRCAKSLATTMSAKHVLVKKRVLVRKKNKKLPVIKLMKND